MENQQWCATEIERPSSTNPRYQVLVMALADFSQRYCVAKTTQGNERAAFGNVEKPSSVKCNSLRY